MPPQPLQFVERPRLGRKDVDQIIPVISQDPLRVGEAFHADGIFAALVQLLADLFHNGLDLFGIASSADHEEIRERSNLAQVQNSDVQGFLGFRGSNGSKPRRGAERRCGGMRGRIVLLSDS